VPLGNEANERFAVHHDQRADVIFGHFRDGIEHGRVWMNGADFSALLIQQLPYRDHGALLPPANLAWRD
jgi:hypothetical protein